MRNTKYKIGLLGIFSIVAISLFITIAWAAFSSSLNIKGTATISKQSWDLEFTTSSDSSTVTYPVSLIGEDYLTVTGSAVKPTSTESGLRFTDAGTITGTIGTLSQPGDKLTYSGLYVRNYGTFDAEISFSGLLDKALSNGTNVKLTCSSLDSTKMDDDAAQDFCNNYVVAKLQYGETSVTNSSKITLSKAGEESAIQPFTLSFEYITSESTSSLAASDISITLGTITLSAKQV